MLIRKLWDRVRHGCVPRRFSTRVPGHIDAELFLRHVHDLSCFQSPSSLLRLSTPHTLALKPSRTFVFDRDFSSLAAEYMLSWLNGGNFGQGLDTPPSKECRPRACINLSDTLDVSKPETQDYGSVQSRGLPPTATGHNRTA